jgi:hypothetical protein
MSAMRTTERITFTDFDTTSEISGLDGSTYIVLVVHFTIQFTADQGRPPYPTSASVGITTRQGRRSYELMEPPWAAQPALAEAIVNYARDCERLFRRSPMSEEHRKNPRDVDLEIDLSQVPPA